MNSENDNLRELFERTAPKLSQSEDETIRQGTWRKYHRHKKVLIMQTAIPAIALLIIALTISLKPQKQMISNEWDIALMNDSEIFAEVSQIQDESIISEMIGADGDSIADMLLNDLDIEDALNSLPNEEQNQIFQELVNL